MVRKIFAVVFALRFTGRTAKCKWPLIGFIWICFLHRFLVVLELLRFRCVLRIIDAATKYRD